MCQECLAIEKRAEEQTHIDTQLDAQGLEASPFGEYTLVYDLSGEVIEVYATKAGV